MKGIFEIYVENNDKYNIINIQVDRNIENPKRKRKNH